jgi:K+-transporting ATPase c subunit
MLPNTQAAPLHRLVVYTLIWQNDGSAHRIFWSGPYTAGNGYKSNSGGSNYITNAALIARVNASVKTLNPPGTSVPVDLVTIRIRS